METKKCKVCGRELPITEFAELHYGRAHTCKECITQAKKNGIRRKNEIESLRAELERAKAERLSSFEPRELLAELKRRGYKWEKMSIVIEHLVDYNKI